MAIAQRAALGLRRPEAPLDHALRVGVQRHLQQLADRWIDAATQHRDALRPDRGQDVLGVLQRADGLLLGAGSGGVSRASWFSGCEVVTVSTRCPSGQELPCRGGAPQQKGLVR